MTPRPIRGILPDMAKYIRIPVTPEDERRLAEAARDDVVQSSAPAQALAMMRLGLDATEQKRAESAKRPAKGSR